MSYQFEDESALEELLNQQLERRKQPQPARQSIAPAQQQPLAPSAAARRPSSSMTTTKLASQQQQFRPSTAQAQPKAAASSGEPATGKSKLASWLEGKAQEDKATGQPVDTRQNEPESFSRRNIRRSETLRSPDGDDDEPRLDVEKLRERFFNEDNLQEMSKQRIIQLVLDELQPVLVKLSENSQGEASGKEFRQLQAELQSERERSRTSELLHLERIKLEQSKWSQWNEQLEARLASSENELQRTIASQQEHLSRVNEQHERDLAKLSDNYEKRLREERNQFDETLRRRDEMHQLELRSKLSVDVNLSRLDTLQSECSQTIKSTLRQLEEHFKSIESLLDRQAMQVNGTNCELIEKTKQLTGRHEKFEQLGAKMGELVDGLRVFVPKYSSLHEQNETILGRISQSLGEFRQTNESLSQKELELNILNNELQLQRETLGEEQRKVALELMKLGYKEEKLDESLRSTKELELRLAEQKSSQSEREIRLQSQQTSLDAKANELRAQNYDLHLMRKSLTQQKEELARAQQELANERKLFGQRVDKLNARAGKLSKMSQQIQCELEQLNRLRRSLICSLCLERLFPADQYQPSGGAKTVGGAVGRSSPAAAGDARRDLDANGKKKIGHLVLFPIARPTSVANHQDDADEIAKDWRQNELSLELHRGGGGNNDDLNRLTQQVQQDRRQLASECKYIELISANLH